MNITLEKVDAVNAVITVDIVPDDYADSYKKAIKEFRKQANLPGFRKGYVPEGLIKKQYGTSILADEINKLLQGKLYDYIRDNKVNMLGEPLPTEENNSNVIADGNSFKFKFEIALAPEFNVELSKDDKLDYYDVEVSDDMVNSQIEMYRQRGGSYQKVDSYQENDMLKGVITELDKDEVINEEGVVLLPKYFKNEEQKTLFADAKLNDTVKFNPSIAYDNNEAELSSLLRVDKEKLGEHKGEFNFKISEITRFVPGDLDEKLFRQVYPDGSVKTPEEFKAKIREAIEEQFKKDADYRFIIDARKYITDKIGKLQFPDEKLKKIMLANTKGDEKKVEDNYELSINELTWHLIKEKLVEQTGVKVDDKDVIEMGKEVTRMQFAQYGMFNVPAEMLDNAVKEMMTKRETVDNLIDRCIEMKLGTVLKEKVTLNVKKVTAEEFNKLFE